MTRNLFTQLADMAEYHIRWGRSFVSRERAADLMSDWDAFSESDELQAEILSRFPKAEPPSVPGLDFLPATQADAAVLVAEAVAVLDQPKAERHCDDCGHAESRHSRLKCNGSSETERCWCYAFRLPERAS